MSSTSSSISTTGSSMTTCRCGIPARIRTSWTDDNPGRRFYGCSNWKRGGGGCGFFEWHDLPIEGRARYVILTMLKKEREMEVKIRELELKTKELEKELGMVAHTQAAKTVGSCSIL